MSDIGSIRPAGGIVISVPPGEAKSLRGPEPPGAPNPFGGTTVELGTARPPIFVPSQFAPGESGPAEGGDTLAFAPNMVGN